MINTAPKKIEEILMRGVEKIYPNKKALEKKLLSGEKIKLYCGYDPSGPTLHLGHTISLRKLAQFQKLGHEVIMLVGDFTGMIGDPTDKLSARKKLTREEVLKNSANYKKIASKFLDFSGPSPAKVLYNSQWSDMLTFRDIIEIASNFTVQQMIVREMFQNRIKDKKPIYLHEFLYPLAQAHDSVAMDIDLEIGGADQTFNMLCGRDLMKALKNKEKFVLTLKLLADPAGKKMGKTTGNLVPIDEKPDQMFGKIMSWPDELIIPGLELLTDVSMEEIEKDAKTIKESKVNPREIKTKLAKEVVSICYDKRTAQKAEEEFNKIFKEKEFPPDASKTPYKDGIYLSKFLHVSGVTSSTSVARKLIEQGAVEIDGEVQKDWRKIIKIKRGEEKKLKVGKKIFRRIIRE